MSVTYFVAVPFRLSADGDIVAGEPQECHDGSKAKRVASIFAADPRNCRAIAFSRSGEPDLVKIGEVDGAAAV